MATVLKQTLTASPPLYTTTNPDMVLSDGKMTQRRSPISNTAARFQRHQITSIDTSKRKVAGSPPSKPRAKRQPRPSSPPGSVGSAAELDVSELLGDGGGGEDERGPT